MKIEEAIVYVLASSGHGMKTEQIAREINERGLFHRWDKAPVDGSGLSERPSCFGRRFSYLDSSGSEDY